MTDYAPLLLRNQLCFPLYACSKEIVRRYDPLLKPLDLTYTQYITMMVLWEHETMSVSALGKELWLDSGTLTPVLKKLESKGYVSRDRSPDDERSVIISLTENGRTLREKAKSVPAAMSGCVRLSPEDAMQLHNLLYKVLAGIE